MFDFWVSGLYRFLQRTCPFIYLEGISFWIVVLISSLLLNPCNSLTIYVTNANPADFENWRKKNNFAIDAQKLLFVYSINLIPIDFYMTVDMECNREAFTQSTSFQQILTPRQKSSLVMDTSQMCSVYTTNNPNRCRREEIVTLRQVTVLTFLSRSQRMKMGGWKDLSNRHDSNTKKSSFCADMQNLTDVRFPQHIDAQKGCYATTCDTCISAWSRLSPRQSPLEC